MKLSSSFSLSCMVLWVYMLPDPFVRALDTIQDNNIHEGIDPLHIHRCNFSEYEDVIGQKFKGEGNDDHICTVKLTGQPVAFTYACQGVSHPWDCPRNVIYEDKAIELKSLFNQCTIDRDNQLNHSRPAMYTVLLSQHRQAFTAHCMCEHDDGKIYIIRITSGASGRRPSRFLTWIIVVVFALYMI